MNQKELKNIIANGTCYDTFKMLNKTYYTILYNGVKYLLNEDKNGLIKILKEY